MLIERKVLASIGWSLLGSIVLAVLNSVQHSDLLYGLPAGVQAVIIAAGVPALTAAGGIIAKHTHRPSVPGVAPDGLAVAVGTTAAVGEAPDVAEVAIPAPTMPAAAPPA